ncbi:Acyl-coenzyme A thioesterase THEM4 [Desulfarculales bacterium]
MSAIDQRLLADDGLCFACGEHNSQGLGMHVRLEENQAHCLLTLPSRYQGWAGIAHGGIVCTVLDEVMAHAVIHFIGQGVTTSIETTFRKPVPLRQEIKARGWIVQHRGRLAESAGEIRLAKSDALLVQAKARWLIKMGPDGQPIPRFG